MKETVQIKSFINDKREERFLIEDVAGNVLHKAGGPGFKSIETAETFAVSHNWAVVTKPEQPKTYSLF